MDYFDRSGKIACEESSDVVEMNTEPIVNIPDILLAYDSTTLNNEEPVVSFDEDNLSNLSSSFLDIRKIKKQVVEINMQNQKYTVKRFNCRETNAQRTGIYCLQFDADILVLGLRSGNIEIRNARTYDHLTTLRGHTGSVYNLQFYDKTLFSASGDCIRIWNLNDYSLVSAIDFKEDRLRYFKFNMGRLVTCSDKGVNLWNIEDLQNVKFIKNLTENIPKDLLICNSVDVNDNYIIASIGKKIHVWNNGENYGEISQIGDHEKDITCCLLNGSNVISGSYDTTCRIWNITTGKCLNVLRAHENILSCVRVYGDKLLTSSYLRIILWDYEKAVKSEPSDKVKILPILIPNTNWYTSQLDEHKIVTGLTENSFIVFDFLNH